jgi:Lysine methyltransferase
MPVRWPFGKSRGGGNFPDADSARDNAERHQVGMAADPGRSFNPSAPVIAYSNDLASQGVSSHVVASGGDGVSAFTQARLGGAVPIRFTVPVTVDLAPAAMAIDLELIEAQMVAVLTERLDTLGEAESGLGAYYARRIRSGKAFGEDDRMLLEVLARDYLSYDGIVEVGSGYGQLGLALGVQGRQVICVETDRKRFACMEALKAALEPMHPVVAQNVSLRFGTWPALLKAEDPSGSLLVAVDFVYTGSGDIEGAAIAELKRYGGAIIDVSHFVHSRHTPEARDGFYRALQTAGFADSKPLPPHQSSRNSMFVFATAK